MEEPGMEKERRNQAASQSRRVQTQRLNDKDTYGAWMIVYGRKQKGVKGRDMTGIQKRKEATGRKERAGGRKERAGTSFHERSTTTWLTKERAEAPFTFREKVQKEPQTLKEAMLSGRNKGMRPTPKGPWEERRSPSGRRHLDLNSNTGRALQQKETTPSFPDSQQNQ